MGSIANIDENKILFPLVPNTIRFTYQIRYVLQEKQFYPLHHGPVTDYLKVNNPKIDKNQL